MSKLALLLSLAFMHCLELVWRFIIKRSVRSPIIIKFYVIFNTFYELCFRFVLISIYLFPLHGSEKRLRYSIIMRPAWLGKRLDNLVHAQHLTKCIRYILRSLITVKCQALRSISVLERPPKCGRDQICTVLCRYTVGNYLSRKQVKDHANIKILIIYLKAGHIADPNPVRLTCMELPLKNILSLVQPFPPPVISLGRNRNAL